MLSPSDVPRLVLDACPSFQEKWVVIEEENDDPGSVAGRLLYVDAGDLVAHVCDLFLAGLTEEFPAVFDLIERLIVEGDSYVSNLGVIGYVEGFTMMTVTRRGIDPDATFQPWMRPVSALWWERLDRFWAGDAGALNDPAPKSDS